jgi:hypothetical protein
MIYGEIQCYSDEVASWVRSINFRKGEVADLLRQVSVIMNFPLVPLPHLKTGNALTDRLMVQQQQFDNLQRQFVDHEKLLKRALGSPERLASPIVERQSTFRNRMRTYELTFIKTKYSCSVFLSDFFQPVPVAVQL